MVWTSDMCASQPCDLFPQIPTENMPDIHRMIQDGYVVDGLTELPPSLETEDIQNVGSRMRNNFDALDAQEHIAGFALPSNPVE